MSRDLWILLAAFLVVGAVWLVTAALISRPEQPPKRARLRIPWRVRLAAVPHRLTYWWQRLTILPGVIRVWEWQYRKRSELHVRGMRRRGEIWFDDDDDWADTLHRIGRALHAARVAAYATFRPAVVYRPASKTWQGVAPGDVGTAVTRDGDPVNLSRLLPAPRPDDPRETADTCYCRTDAAVLRALLAGDYQRAVLAPFGSPT